MANLTPTRDEITPSADVAKPCASRDCQKLQPEGSYDSRWWTTWPRDNYRWLANIWSGDDDDDE